MRTYIKLGLTALIAAMLLASALSIASARNLEFSNLHFRVEWSRMEFRSALVTIRCQLTLEGSFRSRTIPKIERLWIANITRINIHEPSCTNGRVTPGGTPPWRLTYENFAGRLPRITQLGLLLQRFQFLIEALGINCTYGTETDSITFSAILLREEQITNLQPRVGSNIANLREGGGLCPSTGTLEANAEDGEVTLLNSSTTVVVRLI